MSTPELEAGARAMEDERLQYTIEQEAGRIVVWSTHANGEDEIDFSAETFEECEYWIAEQAFAAGVAAYDKARAGET